MTESKAPSQTSEHSAVTNAEVKLQLSDYQMPLMNALTDLAFGDKKKLGFVSLTPPRYGRSAVLAWFVVKMAKAGIKRRIRVALLSRRSTAIFLDLVRDLAGHASSGCKVTRANSEGLTLACEKSGGCCKVDARQLNSKGTRSQIADNDIVLIDDCSFVDNKASIVEQVKAVKGAVVAFTGRDQTWDDDPEQVYPEPAFTWIARD